MNPVSRFFYEIQEMSILVWRVLVGVKRGPRYPNEIIAQMDEIGVGSLIIIILTGFLRAVCLFCRFIRRLHPTVLRHRQDRPLRRPWSANWSCALRLMVAGRVGSAISAELGSMVVLSRSMRCGRSARRRSENL